MSFDHIYDLAISLKGTSQAVESLLPVLADTDTLASRSDHYYLSEITRCVFRCGFVWRVVDQKWSGFEAAFKGFVPAYWQQVSPDILEALAVDRRIIRNLQKIRTVPGNARMIVEASRSHGGFGQFLAQWSSSEQVELLLWLKAHGERLGGTTAQYFLRLVGWDGFILSPDVVFALRREQLLDASPLSKRGLRQAQSAFDKWHAETGMPYSHLSRILSLTIPAA